jgi:SAM-dependent methyltransferase
MARSKSLRIALHFNRSLPKRVPARQLQSHGKVLILSRESYHGCADYHTSIGDPDQRHIMSAKERENVSFYDALASDYHLFFSDLNRNMEQEGQWLASVLHSQGVHTVLDASCGAGRQSVPLCERGFDVTAADPSAAMLRQAATTARAHGVDFPLLNAGFADLSAHFRGEFDAVIALGNGLCNLEHVEDIEGALRSMHLCCRPGGICLIGIKDFEAIKRAGERFHGHRMEDLDGIRTILFEVWDFEDPLLISTAYLVRDPQNGEQPTVRLAQTHEYMLYEAELRRLARVVGFKQMCRLEHSSEAAYALHR